MFVDALTSSLTPDAQGIVRLPSLVKGQLRFPASLTRAALAPRLRELRSVPNTELQPFRLGDSYVIPQAAADSPGEEQVRFVVLPYAEAGTLIESDTPAIARDLLTLPVAEILAFVRAVGDVLANTPQWLADAAGISSPAGVLDRRSLQLSFQMLPMLLDPDAMGEAIDRELGTDWMPGRQFLDGWVPVPARARRGMNARIRDVILPSAPAAEGDGAACVRAVPTRQLHVTAGNSPLMPAVSWLRAVATKGAAVIKCPVEATATTAVLALAMHAVDPRHPIARHTSFVYWKGGDRATEDALLAPNSFDRLVVWGGEAPIHDLVGRAPHLKSVVFRPRYGASLIGSEALHSGLERTAIAAASDSTIGNQHACLASLVHYVEGPEALVVRYCEALASALALWDVKVPAAPSPASVGRLRRLQRGVLADGRWWQNRAGGAPGSAVVLVDDPFDVAAHPMSRLVVVRRVDTLDEAIPFLSASVAAVGVAPESRRLELRDAIASAGVSNIMPLGECERGYPGIPHDGMRVLSELVNWTTG